MDKHDLSQHIRETFAYTQGSAQPSIREPVYCAIMNFTMPAKNLEISDRARVFVNDFIISPIPNDQGTIDEEDMPRYHENKRRAHNMENGISAVNETTFKQSGFSQTAFGGYVANLLYPHLLKNRVQGLDLKTPDVAYFVTDQETLNRIANDFDDRKFTFMASNSRNELLGNAHNHVNEFKFRTDNGMVVVCNHLDA